MDCGSCQPRRPSRCRALAASVLLAVTVLSFGCGDVLFVPAGVVHRFEDFSDELVVWVVFYGPEGGEATAAASEAR